MFRKEYPECQLCGEESCAFCRAPYEQDGEEEDEEDV